MIFVLFNFYIITYNISQRVISYTKLYIFNYCNPNKNLIQLYAFVNNEKTTYTHRFDFYDDY